MAQTETNRCAKVFLQATADVLTQVLDEVGTLGEIVQVSQPVALLQVAVILGLTGDHEGRVLFEFSHDTALKIAGIMNFGEVFQEMDDMARATLAELGNLVAGRAATILNDSGESLQISPPILMCGTGMCSSDLHLVTRMSVTMSVGDVVVNLSSRPKARPARMRNLGPNGPALN